MIGLALSFLIFSARADVLVLDLNNATGEDRACVEADPGNVFVVNKKTMGKPRIDAAVVEHAVELMEKSGKSIDTIVISGHDGNGEFFGGDRDENSFTAGQLTEILGRHAKTKASLKNMALWGCYTGNVSAAETQWLRPNKGAVFTIGFPMQSPNKYSMASQRLLGEFCKPENRAAAARAASKEALCEFYNRMPLLAALDASVSNCSNMATRLYGRNKCFSFEELKGRCDEFDPDDQMFNLYRNYMTATETGFEQPPLDGGDVGASPAKTPLRKYYDQIHLWRHCADTLKKDFGYPMPNAAQVIRLVKFTQLRDNINRLNRAELNEYDARLRELGLGHLALGDLRLLNRAAINLRVNQAVRQLSYMAGQGVRAGTTRADAMLVMARGIKGTLVDLLSKQRDRVGRKYRCSHFSLVHAGVDDPGRRSQCIRSYSSIVRSL